MRVLRVMLIALAAICTVGADQGDYDTDTIEAILRAVSPGCKEEMERALTSPDGDDITARCCSTRLLSQLYVAIAPTDVLPLG